MLVASWYFQERCSIDFSKNLPKNICRYLSQKWEIQKGRRRIRKTFYIIISMQVLFHSSGFCLASHQRAHFEHHSFTLVCLQGLCLLCARAQVVKYTYPSVLKKAAVMRYSDHMYSSCNETKNILQILHSVAIAPSSVLGVGRKTFNFYDLHS